MRLKNVEKIIQKIVENVESQSANCSYTLKNDEFKIENLEKTYINLAIHFSKNFSSTLTAFFKVVVVFQKQYSEFLIFFDWFLYDIWENLGKFYIFLRFFVDTAGKNEKKLEYFRVCNKKLGFEKHRTICQ